MKKTLFLFLFIPALAQAQSPGIAQHHGIYWDTITTHFGIRTCDTIPQEWAEGITFNPGFGIGSFTNQHYRVPDCEPWETFTEWAAKNAGKAKCAHEWAYAEWNEVNTVPAFTTLEMPPPCGKTRTDNEARICRHCLRHETRVRTHGMKEVIKKSEYQSLLEKIHDR